MDRWEEGYGAPQQGALVWAEHFVFSEPTKPHFPMIYATRFLLLSILLLPGCFLARKTSSMAPPEMVVVSGGSFRMGDIFEEENEDAIPVHEVMLPTFQMSRYEITYAQYDVFALETGRALPDDNGYGRGDRAVANVSWEDAVAYCAHYGYRLPTEVEWEYAARSGGKAHRFAGTDSLNAVDRYVRHIDNSMLHSFNVGSKEPNELGLYDMSGNVYEWIGDYYEFYPSEGDEPQYKDLSISSMRILRGGSFKTPPNLTQTFWRSGTLGDIPSDAIGFRCVRE